MQTVNSFDLLTLKNRLEQDNLNYPGVYYCSILKDSGAVETIYNSYLPCRAACGTEGADYMVLQFNWHNSGQFVCIKVLI